MVVQTSHDRLTDRETKTRYWWFEQPTGSKASLSGKKVRFSWLRFVCFWLGKDFMQDIAMHVSQTEISASGAVCEGFVINSQLMQYGGPEIVHS